MDWSTLREFLVIASLGSISGAAEALGVSQPALSRRLAQLEEELDITLFLRSNRGLTLTAAGERVRTFAQQMSTQAQRIEDVAKLGHDPVGGLVRITAPEGGLATRFLPEQLLRLRQSYPDLVIELRADNRFADLSKRDADIAIRMQRPTAPQLTARKLGSVRWNLYASPAYLAGLDPIRSLDGLASTHLLIHADAGDTRQHLWMKRHGLEDRVVLRSNSVDTLTAATRSGWGIALLPALVAEADEQLARVPVNLDIQLDAWLVTHATLRRSPKIRIVFDYIVQCFKEHRARLAPP